MSEILIAAGAFALLFIGFGLLGRGRTRNACEHCTCHDGRCVRADAPKHLELLE